MSESKIGKNQVCQICAKSLPWRDLYPASLVRAKISEFIKTLKPTWDGSSGFICQKDLSELRLGYIRSQLEKDRGKVTELEAAVLRELASHEITASNLNSAYSGSKTFGEKVSDKLAEFGGSWTFIIFFGVVLALWICFNSLIDVNERFDPFPFIFLNLILSCLAAIQAPIIMMSQNRQEMKDRLRSDEDYKTNLKAELEIRSLNAKIDQLFEHQWQTLMEVQQIQTETLGEIARKIK